MISAKVLLDSISPAGTRLVTFECTYPRFIHSEFMTHRMISRSSASSRAIPSHKLIERIRRDPALPVFWGQNQSGMQAASELPNTDDKRVAVTTDLGDTIHEETPLEYVQRRWLAARDQMIAVAEELADLGKVHHEWAGLGLHKQIANRVLEPWMPITVIASATHWSNFWHLRTHKAAQPEFQVLAKLMKNAYDASEGRRLKVGDWHMPLIFADDWSTARLMAEEQYPDLKGDEGCVSAIATEILCKVSTGRCARISYLTHDGRRDLKEDIALHDRLLAGLVTQEPLHMSPFEHVARALDMPTRSGNFIGFEQYRKTISGEAGPSEHFGAAQ